MPTTLLWSSKKKEKSKKKKEKLITKMPYHLSTLPAFVLNFVSDLALLPLILLPLSTEVAWSTSSEASTGVEEAEGGVEPSGTAEPSSDGSRAPSHLRAPTASAREGDEEEAAGLRAAVQAVAYHLAGLFFVPADTSKFDQLNLSIAACSPDLVASGQAPLGNLPKELAVAQQPALASAEASSPTDEGVLLPCPLPALLSHARRRHGPVGHPCG